MMFTQQRKRSLTALVAFDVVKLNSMRALNKMILKYEVAFVLSSWCWTKSSLWIKLSAPSSVTLPPVIFPFGSGTFSLSASTAGTISFTCRCKEILMLCALILWCRVQYSGSYKRVYHPCCPCTGWGYYVLHPLFSEGSFCSCRPHLLHGKWITLTSSESQLSARDDKATTCPYFFPNYS